MASAAAAGGSNDDDNDNSRVYRAVRAGESAEEVKRLIALCEAGGGGDDQQRRRRLAAVNYKGGARGRTETPLQAAHRRKRGDLVGALVEAGADVRALAFSGRRLTPLALCVMYGQAGSVSALLRAAGGGGGGGKDLAAEKIRWDPAHGFGGHFCFPAHFCIAPASVDNPARKGGAPQVGCLEVLWREGRADIAEARDWRNETPVYWLAMFGSAYGRGDVEAALDLLVAAGTRVSDVFDGEGNSPLMVAASHGNLNLARALVERARVPVDERSPESGSTALHRAVEGGEDPAVAALLLDAGADIDARDARDATPLAMSVAHHKIAPTRLLLDRGASADVSMRGGWTPLILATERPWLGDARWPLLREILARSSAGTRRAVGEPDGSSAVDLLARCLLAPIGAEAERAQERCRSAIADLLASGAPVLPRNQPRVLAIAAALGAAGRQAPGS